MQSSCAVCRLRAGGCPPSKVHRGGCASRSRTPGRQKRQCASDAHKPQRSGPAGRPRSGRLPGSQTPLGETARPKRGSKPPTMSSSSGQATRCATHIAQAATNSCSTRYCRCLVRTISPTRGIETDLIIYEPVRARFRAPERESITSLFAGLESILVPVFTLRDTTNQRSAPANCSAHMHANVGSGMRSAGRRH
jgi:hypothetical protein